MSRPGDGTFVRVTAPRRAMCAGGREVSCARPYTKRMASATAEAAAHIRKLRTLTYDSPSPHRPAWTPWSLLSGTRSVTLEWYRPVGLTGTGRAGPHGRAQRGSGPGPWRSPESQSGGVFRSRCAAPAPPGRSAARSPLPRSARDAVSAFATGRFGRRAPHSFRFTPHGARRNGELGPM